MSLDIDEGNLRFSFSNGWVVEKYDTSSHFKKLHGGIAYTAGVDFLCRSPHGELLLMEAKDYRPPGAKPQNKDKGFAKAVEFTDQLAWKARDTLAGILGGCLRAALEIAPLIEGLGHGENCGMSVRFILFIEKGPASSRLMPPKVWRSKLQQALGNKLRPLGLRVRVYDRSSLPRDAGWSVRSLPMS